MARPSVALATLLAALVSCGREPDAKQLVDEPISQTELIHAGNGGSIHLIDGANLTIPAGALVRDSKVTLVRETCAGVYASRVFSSCLYSVEIHDLRPGSRFALEIPRVKQADEACVVEQGIDGFRCLVDSEAGNSGWRATASRASSFVVTSVTSDDSDGRGADLPFAPCGGDVLGTWTLLRSAGSLEQLSGVGRQGGTDPFSACDAVDALVDHPTRIEGSIVFNRDGTWLEKHSVEVRRHEIIADRCLEAIGEPCGAGCKHTSGLCDCLSMDIEGDDSGGGAWTAKQNGTLTFDQGEDVPYCVNDNVLTIGLPSPTGSYLMIYER